MTGAIITTYIIFTACFLLMVWLQHRILEKNRMAATIFLEHIGEIRLLMEDMRSRDPQLEEMLSVALLNVDRYERQLHLVKDVSLAPWSWIPRKWAGVRR